MDMQFDQPSWWRRALSEPERALRISSVSYFPRQSGIALARATLTLAWNGVQADRTAASVVPGMDSEVAALISSMPLTSIDRFAARHFRRVRPRWADRIEFWRQLLAICEAGARASAHDLDVRGLRFLLADPWRTEAARP